MDTRTATQSKHADAVADYYDPATFEPTRNLGKSLARVRLAIVDAFDAELAPFEITAAQYVIIVMLAAGEADSASGLCRGISYDPGAMTRMLDRLERRGLIRRVPRPNDRRAVGLELTEEGKAVYPKLRAVAAGILNRFLRGFSRSEVETLLGFLDRMLANA